MTVYLIYFFVYLPYVMSVTLQVLVTAYKLKERKSKQEKRIVEHILINLTYTA